MLSVDNPWKLFAFAGLSACCGEMVSQPFDVAKTRMQIQGHSGSPPLYRHSLHAFTSIARAEGWSALYSGIRPALLRQATYGSLRMGLYEPCKVALQRAFSLASQEPPSSPLLLRGLAGALSGSLSSFICSPTDLLKVRMQADSTGARGYRGVGDALRKISASEGLLALWTGAVPTAQRAALVAAAELAGYETCKEALVDEWGWAASHTPTHLCASLLAGFGASLLSSPVEVVRVRLMEAAPGRYRGGLHCLLSTVGREGPQGLFAGFPADFARRCPHTVTSFLVLEQLRRAFGGAQL